MFKHLKQNLIAVVAQIQPHIRINLQKVWHNILVIKIGKLTNSVLKIRSEKILQITTHLNLKLT